jgi:phage terminase small subunit
MIANKQRKIQRRLTTKMARFVDAYDGNATEAARKAGYKQPKSQGQRLLTNVDIEGAIRRREEKRNAPLIADRRERQMFWTEGMRNTKLSMSERIKHSELLGRSEADFTDRKQVDIGIVGLEEALDAAEGTGRPPIKEQ